MAKRAAARVLTTVVRRSRAADAAATHNISYKFVKSYMGMAMGFCGNPRAIPLYVYRGIQYTYTVRCMHRSCTVRSRVARQTSRRQVNSSPSRHSHGRGVRFQELCVFDHLPTIPQPPRK